MKFKDILNREVVNLTNCEHEPIHIPGSIQPHGFLIGLKISDLSIDFCSANVFSFTGLAYEQLLGNHLSTLVDPYTVKRWSEHLSNSASAGPFPVRIGDTDYTCAIHTQQLHCIAEFEPVGHENLEVADVYLQTRQFTSYMQQAGSLQELCQAVAEETRRLTDYDRVMIYKFDEHYNGHVFAESCVETVEPFLNLHYPSTDIPPQARELYVRNLLRIITDVHYSPIPVYTIDDAPEKNLDLSLSILRSVSPIHIQYLKNMGVGATLTISLLHEGRLWGLIACHHYSPKYISPHTRLFAQLQGHFLTSQIGVRQDAEEYALALRVNQQLGPLLERVYSFDHSSLEQLSTDKNLLDITNATGCILLVNHRIYTQGLVPPEDVIPELAAWLYDQSEPTGFVTHKLTDHFPKANLWPQVSGIVFHALGSRPGNCIIWCRPETIQEVNWAGDPQKAIVIDKTGLSPRKSFELWKEIKKYESLPWKKPELAAAFSFANALQKQVHILYLIGEEQKQRLLSRQLQEANEELEQMNWISSHDLKEPLRKIQMFASKILDTKPTDIPEPVLDSVKRMAESAKRMQLLVQDILAYSRLNHLSEAFTAVSLREIVENAKEELKEEIAFSNAFVQILDLPAVNGIPFLLKQLFLNLMRNSLKFSRPGQPPHIQVYYEGLIESPSLVGQDFHFIMVRDNGIGFDNKYNEKVFGLFTRLHPAAEYPGVGIGLAMCRKIMQNHKGYILAESSVNEGTKMKLYFPG